MISMPRDICQEYRAGKRVCREIYAFFPAYILPGTILLPITRASNRRKEEEGTKHRRYLSPKDKDT